MPEDDYLIKIISDKLSSDFKKIGIHDRLNNNPESFLNNTEIKLLITNKMGKVNERMPIKSCMSRKGGGSPSKVTFLELKNESSTKQENNEIILSDDVTLKNILKSKLNEEKVRRGKFKTDKGYNNQINRKLLSYIDFHVKTEDSSVPTNPSSVLDTGNK